MLTESRAALRGPFTDAVETVFEPVSQSVAVQDGRFLFRFRDRGMMVCPGYFVCWFFDIVGFLMKGHVGDGAWSGGFKAPDTSI